MTQTRKIPREAVELYDRFIHGEIDRRAFLTGLERFAVAGLTAGALAEALMPNYALGQQVRKDDERIKASYETVPSPNGNGYIRGYFVKPFSADSRSETSAKLPGVIVIHENRGLNPHTEDVARRFALENFMAFAPDALSSVGGYPGDDYKGGQLFSKIDPAKRTADFVAAAQWLKARPDSTGKIGATGFCFGGSWARIWGRPLRSTVARPSRRTCRKSRRPSSSTTAPSIRTCRRPIRRRKRS
jgi:carboxymethylenebutenolidase